MRESSRCARELFENQKDYYKPLFAYIFEILEEMNILNTYKLPKVIPEEMEMITESNLGSLSSMYFLRPVIFDSRIQQLPKIKSTDQSPLLLHIKTLKLKMVIPNISIHFIMNSYQMQL